MQSRSSSVPDLFMASPMCIRHAGLVCFLCLLTVILSCGEGPENRTKCAVSLNGTRVVFSGW